MGFQLVILGDIHVSTRTGRASAAFQRIVAHVAARRPRLVVIAGDATSGNRGDGHGRARVASWWSGLAQDLAPIRSAGIPILPIAGNHDWYTSAHREGYLEAWENLAEQVGGLQLSGHPPRYYSVCVDSLHLALLHVVDQRIDLDVANWLEGDLAAPRAPLVLAVGHVPLRSAMGRASQHYERRLGGILARGRVACYFAGHEHLVWDEPLDFDGYTLRQYIVGTPGASYTFPLKPALRRRYCRGAWGFMPWSGHAFSIKPGTGSQTLEAAFVVVEVDGADYRVTPMGVDGSGGIVPLLRTDIDVPETVREADEVRQLQRALNQLIGAGLAVDGDYGNATRTAVEEFQRRNGLAVDGVAGPVTKAKLRELMST